MTVIEPRRPAVRVLRVAVRLALAGSSVAAVSSVSQVFFATYAFADTQPYELYCPGTPVANFVLNNVVTSGEISPATPTAGSQFQLVDFQTRLTLPASIIEAAQAAGSTAVTGFAVTSVDATGATPATKATGIVHFETPIPSSPSLSGLELAFGAPIGPFTATGGDIKLMMASKSAILITLISDTQPIGLNCKSYANNSIAKAGTTLFAPSGSPIEPAIATTYATGTALSTAAPSTIPPRTAGSGPTTRQTSPSSSAARSVGAGGTSGPPIWLLVLVGATLIGVAVVSFRVRQRFPQVRGAPAGSQHHSSPALTAEPRLEPEHLVVAGGAREPRVHVPSPEQAWTLLAGPHVGASVEPPVPERVDVAQAEKVLEPAPGSKWALWVDSGKPAPTERRGFEDLWITNSR